MNPLSLPHTDQSLPLSLINEQYSRYRLINPKSDSAMIASFKRYGQLTPVIVGSDVSGTYPLIDGFKRLRACRQLGHPKILVQIFNTESRAIKAAMFHLNRQSRSLSQVEEGMIVRSLYREDRLNQVEIATLLGCHKSWVCRRLAMIEKLSPEVLEEVRLGLIGTGLSRELIRLPCGNQAKVLASVRQNKLTCRQTARLVKLLGEKPESEHPGILVAPHTVLSSAPSSKSTMVSGFPQLIKDICAIKQETHGMRNRYSKNHISLAEEDQSSLLSHIREIETDLDHLKTIFKPMEAVDAIRSKS